MALRNNYKKTTKEKYENLSKSDRHKLISILNDKKRSSALTPRNIYTNFREILFSKNSKIPLEESIQNRSKYEIQFNIFSQNTPFVPYIEKNGDLIVERHIEISTPIKSMCMHFGAHQLDLFYIKINEYYINKFKYGKGRKNPDIPIPIPMDNIKCRELFIKYYSIDDYDEPIKCSLIALLSNELIGLSAQNIIWNFFENNILANPNENEYIKRYLPDFYKKYESILIEKISKLSGSFN